MKFKFDFLYLNQDFNFFSFWLSQLVTVNIFNLGGGDTVFWLGASHMVSWLLLPIVFIDYSQGVRVGTVHVFAYLCSSHPRSPCIPVGTYTSSFEMSCADGYIGEREWEHLLRCVFYVDCYVYGTICPSYLLPPGEHYISRFRVGVDWPNLFTVVLSLWIFSFQFSILTTLNFYLLLTF